VPTSIDAVMLFVAMSMTTDPGGGRVDAGVDDGQQAAGGLSTNPNWRRIENDHLIEATDSISFTSVTLGSLATLCDLYRGYTIDWKLGGDLGVIHCTLAPLSGLPMPARPAPPWADDDQAEPR
jgi:hypothetical protein